MENDRAAVATELSQLYACAPDAAIIGVTGATGVGKSTLVAALARSLRKSERTVAILAVDPSSPVTGGAILGDRIRMRSLAGDPGVFIRSLAGRGQSGGLARATRDAVAVLAAAGFDDVLIETVGAGQSEVEIASLADTTIVVLAPGAGDAVQALKAGHPRNCRYPGRQQVRFARRRSNSARTKYDAGSQAAAGSTAGRTRPTGARRP